jgi:hypothetical protein
MSTGCRARPRILICDCFHVCPKSQEQFALD